VNRDAADNRCEAIAVVPSAARINPTGRCRNVVGRDLWAVGVHVCWRHGAPTRAELKAGALAVLAVKP